MTRCALGMVREQQVQFGEDHVLYSNIAITGLETLSFILLLNLSSHLISCSNSFPHEVLTSNHVEWVDDLPSSNH